MYSSKSRFKILLILVPVLVLFLGSDLNSGNSIKPSVYFQDTQQKMTKVDFDKLPDDHIFSYKGRKITKAQILARFNKMRSSSRRIEKIITPAELKTMSEREHQEKVKKDNLKVQEHIKIQAKSERPQKMVASKRPGITSTFSVPPLSPGEDIFIKGFTIMGAVVHPGGGAIRITESKRVVVADNIIQDNEADGQPSAA